MMSLFIKLCRALVVVSLTMPALALADQVLDRIEIIQTKTEADIQIGRASCRERVLTDV